MSGSNGRIKTLDEIALYYGTDKASDGHGYTRLYEKFLGPIRYKSMVLLELGVYHGASVLTWQEYLPNAEIIGVDNFTHVTIDEPRIKILESEQTSEFLGPRIRRSCGDVNVIIDDASHVSFRTIQTFKNLYPYLLPGGLYVIEDLQTSYDVANYGENEACRDPDGNAGLTAMSFCKRLADEVHSDLFPEKYRLGYDLESVQFYRNIVFIVKGGGSNR